jgi:hypothetical protein
VGEDRTGTERRTTVSEAAEILGISAEAVRGRIRRGTISVEREGGTVYVLMEDRTTADQHRTTTDQPDDRTDLLIAELRDRVRSLEEANRENRRIIVALTSRIPAIEAPSEDPVQGAEGQETPPQGQGPVAPPVIRATTPTRILFAAGAGILAGFANPLLISRMDNPLWSALLLLWAFLPAFFGLWLGQTTASSVAATSAELEALGKDPPPQTQERPERSRLSIYAVPVGAVTLLSSLAVYDYGVQDFGDFNPDVVVGIAIAQGIVAAMFVLLGGLLGEVRARARQISGGGTVAEATAADRQALITLVGTGITAVLGLVGVLVQVFAGTGGTGG